MVVVLLRNLAPRDGLCNGTWLIVRRVLGYAAEEEVAAVARDDVAMNGGGARAEGGGGGWRARRSRCSAQR
ncbi:hypothetical protein KFE25_011750 [Diacronema lutheri]|uniref:DNA helicase Pif1-like 2B domain-containing protein n=1 Tax=Diacronema lutheri TaxID=2081491 RepID=A0A8J5X1H7_DIALT|nr:hypothetical protein KFE25_011739 [Diacronema lutheri]KAG8458366.1 hypothetical protein KFE25_011750 [Diacronema lutheri]